MIKDGFKRGLLIRLVMMTIHMMFVLWKAVHMMFVLWEVDLGRIWVKTNQREGNSFVILCVRRLFRWDEDENSSLNTKH